LKDSWKFRTTSHKTIVEQLQYQAERIRRQGRLQDKELENIINEIKSDERQSWEEDEHCEECKKDKQRRVSKTIQEGLLQIHGTTPNNKQPGIYRIMGENCNGFCNRIGGNVKLAKAIDIKDDLDIDCLLYCEHRINFCHKDNKNNLKQMFQWELACTVVSSHNIHEDKHAGRVQEGGTGAICFGEITGYIKKVSHDNLLERLHKAHTGGHSATETARQVILIDGEGKAYMRHAEKICRKLKCCHIPYSPEASIWIR
jgi:hypothetical protein